MDSGSTAQVASAMHGHELVLTTCTNGRDTTWDIALARGYTFMPKPYATPTPELLRPPSWATITLRAWRARRQHGGLIATFRGRALRSHRADATRDPTPPSRYRQRTAAMAGATRPGARGVPQTAPIVVAAHCDWLLIPSRHHWYVP